MLKTNNLYPKVVVTKKDGSAKCEPSFLFYLVLNNLLIHKFTS